jgi:hypothetical protein
LAREHPHLSSAHPAMRLATAILMYSFGGATRAGESEGEVIGAGVAELELLSAVVGPDLDSITAQATLKELREQAQQDKVSEYFTHYGNDLRKYRNGLGLEQLKERENLMPLGACTKTETCAGTVAHHAESAV